MKLELPLLASAIFIRSHFQDALPSFYGILPNAIWQGGLSRTIVDLCGVRYEELGPRWSTDHIRTMSFDARPVATVIWLSASMLARARVVCGPRCCSQPPTVRVAVQYREKVESSQ